MLKPIRHFNLKFPFVWLWVAWLFLGCQSFWKSPEEALKEDWQSYQKDLLFERYESAAMRVLETKRAVYLDGLKSIPGLRFAEIELVAITSCNDLDEGQDPKHCAIVQTRQQWYTYSDPRVQSTVFNERWLYNDDKGTWFLTEQSQN